MSQTRLVAECYPDHGEVDGVLGALMWKSAPYSVKSILNASRERWRAN